MTDAERSCMQHLHPPPLSPSTCKRLAATVAAGRPEPGPHLDVFGDSASSTLSLGPRPLLSVAPFSVSIASAADEARSNLT